MAELGETCSKIVCRSRRAVEQIISTVCSEIKNTLSQNSERIDEHCTRYMQKFRETFTAILSQNILVNGEVWRQDALNDTSEFEPVDRNKERKINDELLPQLDLCIVGIARKRKKLPPLCRKALTDYVNHQAVYLSKVKPQVQDDRLEPVIQEVKQVTDLISCQHLQTSSSTLAFLVKDCQKEHEKMVHLCQAVEIERINRKCKTKPAALSDQPPHSPAKRRPPDSPAWASKHKQYLDASLRTDFSVQPAEKF